MEEIKIENLTFTYAGEESPALVDVSLSLEKGEFLAVTGPTGSGKTTLLRLLNNVLAPKGRIKGNICVSRKPVSEIDEKTQARLIGMVSQNASGAIVTDKVWHELAFGLENLGLPGNEIRPRVAECAEYFGLTDLYYRNTSELSGGEQQILSLASVMILNPEILILDEPTSGLDPIAKERFLDIIDKLKRETDITIIIAEHDLNRILSAADRMAVIEDGRLRCFGKTDKVIKELIENDETDLLPLPAEVYSRVTEEIRKTPEYKNIDNKKTYGRGGNVPVSIDEGRKWIGDYIRSNPSFLAEYMEQSRDRIQGMPHSRINRKKVAGVDKICEPVLEAKSVFFRYSRKEEDVLKNFSLTLGRGEIFAVLGGNGTGKTTAARVISGMEKPYRGKVKALGRIGMLPQDPKIMFCHDTVREEIETAQTGAYESSTGSSRRKESTDICMQEKRNRIPEILAGLMDRHPYDLSKGEQELLALYRVLSMDPDIIILDEPTSGLDKLGRRYLGRELEILAKEGKAILMVSHDLDFCGEYAKKCGLFAGGSLTAVRGSADFMKTNRYYTTSARKMAGAYFPDVVNREDAVCRLLWKS